jgi:cation diffusion facilitator CzcD-associated flavoprotein CzcO
MKESKTVAIIGAGAGGLVCAKVLLDDGFDVALFDRQRELGGIWSAESAYVGLHSQQPGGTFEFSDLYDGQGKIDLIKINLIYF